MKRKRGAPIQLKVSIPDWDMLPWKSQADQYPPFGQPGVSYYPGTLPSGNVVDCLLYRDQGGILRGILNYYGFDSQWEKTGNVNVWVQPGHQRQGIGTALIAEAVERWDIDFNQQRYSRAGAELAAQWLRKSRAS